MNKEYMRQYRLKNKEKLATNDKEYKVANREKINEDRRKCRVKDPQKRRAVEKKYREAHPEIAAARAKRWRLANPNKSRAYQSKWRDKNPTKCRESQARTAEKRRNVPGGKLRDVIKCGIRDSLINGAKAGRHWEDLVGYTVGELKKHLKNLFKPEMTWENYGTYWQVDHKIPIAAFNFETPDDFDFKRCWALKNLQPLEAKENRIKNAKLEKPFQPALAI